jgi:hypothetical protein
VTLTLLGRPVEPEVCRVINGMSARRVKLSLHGNGGESAKSSSKSGTSTMGRFRVRRTVSMLSS